MERGGDVLEKMHAWCGGKMSLWMDDLQQKWLFNT